MCVQNPTTHSNGTGEYPILAPPPYVAGAPYTNIVMAPGVMETEMGAAAPAYHDGKPPVYEEIPIHKPNNQ